MYLACVTSAMALVAAGNVTYPLALGKNELNNNKMTNFAKNEKK